MYPEGYGRCIMCGADRDAPCTIISGGPMECANCNGSGYADHTVPADDREQVCTRCEGTGRLVPPEGERTGDRREVPHFYRASKIGVGEPPEGFMAVKDEPNHYRDEPHTAQCGGEASCQLAVRV